MTSSEPLPKEWEIWTAYVHFADKPKKGKPRPYLILSVGDESSLGLKITSKVPPERFPSLPINDERALTGLLLDSWLQLEPLQTVPHTELGKHIGTIGKDLRNKVAVYSNELYL